MSTAVVRPESVNHRAAKAIALHARDTTEARLFLDMLGLVSGPQGRGILPDDPRQYDVPTLGSVPAADPDGSPIALTVAAERGDRMTTPVGLRALPALEAPAPVKRNRRSANEDLAELERTDPDVAAAAASYDRMVERITSKPAPAALPQPTSEVTAMPPSPSAPSISIDHGSPRGYWKERSLKLPTCDACKRAISKYTADKKAERDARRWAEAQDRAEATVARIEKEVEEALPPPTPISEPAPDELADWELELLNANGGRALEITAEHRAAVDLDVWIDAAQMSPTGTVRALARVASTQLRALHLALDDLARAERATRPTVAR